MSCRFPGWVDSPAAFWDLLLAEGETVGDVPATRWAADAYYDLDPDAPGKMVSRRGGFLPDVEGFDAGFFDLAPREAVDVDPQQRLALELAWEALEDAAIPPLTLRDSDVGVYQGVKFNDYELIKADLGAAATPFTSTGNVEGLVANRVSHFLGLRGPSMAVNASCASSLVAVHLACQALRAGECTLALAGGVQLNLVPETAIALSKLGVLSPDGRCKTFDAAADGYVRGEGGAVVVLKQYEQAVRDGDRVYCVIRGSATNNNGPNPSLPASSVSGQERLIRQACRQAAVDPATVDYVEAHGTGTPVGDPIELAALGAVYGTAEHRRHPLLVGSVKTNIGHLEAAAGIAGLVKLALSLHAGTVPRSLHFHRANPATDLDRLGIRVVARRSSWPEVGERPRRGAVSAFGFGGSNAHAILDAADPALVQRPAAGPPQRPHLLVLSARSPQALASQAIRLRDHLAAHPDLDLQDVAFTAGHARTHFEERAAVLASSNEQARERLREIATGPAGRLAAPGRPVPAPIGAPAGPVFVFPGQGGQWVGMGRELLDREPAFRAAVEECAAAMRPYTDWSLGDVLRGDGAAAELADVHVVQPAVFAMQVGLAALLREWGVRPRAVVGHSMGEVAAAHVAGALDLEDAAHVICFRSRLVHERSRDRGTMAMVELPAGEARALLSGVESLVCVAATNSPRSTVLSGDRGTLEALLADLTERQVYCRLVKVNYASHSPQMDELRPDLLAELADIRAGASRVPWYSTVTGRRHEDPPDAAYWARNLREEVRLLDAVQAAARDGHRLFVELSPHPLLSTAVEEGAEAAAGPEDGPAAVLSTMERDGVVQDSLLAAVGGLYCHGAEPDWRRLFPHGRAVPLPTYPFQRERHWVGAGSVLPRPRPAAAQAAPVAGQAGTPVVGPVGTPGARESLRRAPAADRLPLLERHVVGEAAAVLGIAADRVGLDVSFERLGLRSRLAIELCRRLERQLELRLSSAVVWGHPTARKLAHHLHGLTEVAAAAEVPAAPPLPAEYALPASAAELSDEDLIRLGEQLLT